MHRRYDTALFRHKIEKIKTAMPHAFIGVDVIVGTRGETDELFDETRAFIESLDISQLHVFSYSERPGTQALKIDYVVDPKTKHARSQQLLELSERKWHAFYDAHIGQTASVLFEQARKKGMMLLHGKLHPGGSPLRQPAGQPNPAGHPKRLERRPNGTANQIARKWTNRLQSLS